jgi:hypothetical protein
MQVKSTHHPPQAPWLFLEVDTCTVQDRISSALQYASRQATRAQVLQQYLKSPSHFFCAQSLSFLTWRA